MKVKLDENLSLTHVHILKRAGYDAERVHDEGLSGATDGEIWEAVVREKRFFITLDLDFADIRKISLPQSPGLLIIRPRTRARDAVSLILKKVLREYRLEEFKGCLVVADENKTRIRKL